MQDWSCNLRLQYCCFICGIEQTQVSWASYIALRIHKEGSCGGGVVPPQPRSFRKKKRCCFPLQFFFLDALMPLPIPCPAAHRSLCQVIFLSLASQPLQTILTFDTLHCIARSQFHSGQIIINSLIDILIQEPSLSPGCTCMTTSSAEPSHSTASKPSQLETVSGCKKNCSGTAVHT